VSEGKVCDVESPHLRVFRTLVLCVGVLSLA
jgi:hypothetical protein